MKFKKINKDNVDTYASVSFGGIFIWILLSISGLRISRVGNSSVDDFFFYVILGCIFTAICLVCFSVRFASCGGMTPFKYEVKGMSIANKSKKLVTLIFCAAFFGLGGASTSQGLCAWVMKIIANEPFYGEYHVIGKQGRGSNGYEMQMISVADHNEYTLRVSNSVWRHYRWEKGDKICLYGDTSVLGVSVRIFKKSC